MKIELYLKKINQENIKSGNEVNPTKCEIYGSWTVSCCILQVQSSPKKCDYLIRKEEFGGLLWDSKTGSVYKLDEEAYRTLTELEKIKKFTYTDASIIRVAQRANVSIESAKNLLSTLQKLMLV